MESRLTPEGIARQRQMAAISIKGAVALVVFGVVLLFAIPKAGAGLLCVIFGGCALLLWAFLLPSYRRRGLI